MKSRPLSVVSTPWLGPSISRTVGRPIGEQSGFTLARKSICRLTPLGTDLTSSALPAPVAAAKQVITIKPLDRAALDEIHETKRFKTPLPYRFDYQNRA